MTYKFKIRTSLAIAYLLLNSMLPTSLWSQDISQKIDNKDFDPSTLPPVSSAISIIMVLSFF